jgi:signal transduction histidine kinase
LFIARSLIEGQGGSISSESVVGQGTQMTVKLPKQTGER